MPRAATGSVRVRRRATGTVFELRFSAYGERQFLRLGTSEDGWTQARAEEELQNVLADVRRGHWRPPVPTAAVIVTDPTFHEFASDWFAEYEREALAPATIDHARALLVTHVLPFFARHHLSQITIAEVDAYRQKKVGEGRLAPGTINRTITLLGAVLEVAVERDLIPRNPTKVNARRRRLKTQRRPRPHVERPAHVLALLDAARDLDVNSRVDRRELGRRPLIAVLAFAGLRIDEACRLRWRDLDLDGRRLRVPGTKSEASADTIDLVPVLVDELDTYRESRKVDGAPPDPDALVFTTAAGTARDRHNARQRVVQPVVKRANELLVAADQAPLPERLTAHGLRHGFASILVALGRDPKYVQRQLRHADAAFTLNVYAHALDADEAERAAWRALVAGEIRTLADVTGPDECGPMGTSPNVRPLRRRVSQAA